MRKIAIAATTVIWLTAACSGSSSANISASGSGAGTPAGSPTASGACTQASATDLTAGPTVNLTVQGFAFHPACFVAKLDGQKLSITNQDSTTHTFTVDGTPVNLSIPAGHTVTTSGSASVSLTAGEHPFHCSIHTTMTGTFFLVG